jgi:hypothetical protein
MKFVLITLAALLFAVPAMAQEMPPAAEPGDIVWSKTIAEIQAIFSDSTGLKANEWYFFDTEGDRNKAIATEVGHKRVAAAIDRLSAEVKSLSDSMSAIVANQENINSALARSITGAFQLNAQALMDLTAAVNILRNQTP